MAAPENQQTENRNISIVSWPKESAKLEHSFQETPCPVSISFEKSSANVFVQTNPGQPIQVEMAMNVVAKEVFPICIQMCEPICAKSDYAIGIVIFDHPVASISVKGVTRFQNCREELG